MNFNVAIVLWLVAFTAGLLASCDSVRLAHLALCAVRQRREPREIIDDAAHWRRDQILKTLFGALYLGAGIIGLLLPPQNPPPPTTFYGTVLTWLLVAGGVIWGYTKVVDWLHTRQLWGRNANKGLVATDRELAASSELQRALAQTLNEAQLDSIAVTGDDTNLRVRNVEDAVVQTDAVAAEHMTQTTSRLDQTTDRLDALEATSRADDLANRATRRRLVETGEDTNKTAHEINDKLVDSDKFIT